MDTGRGTTRTETIENVKLSNMRPSVYQSDRSKTHTNGYKNGINGRTNGKSDQGGNWQDDFFESFEETPFHIAILTYLGYALMIIIGHFRDFLRYYGIEKDKSCTEPKKEGFSPLLVSWESFYTRNMYRHARDCWNRPISSAPGPMFDVMETVSHDHNWNIEYDSAILAHSVPLLFIRPSYSFCSLFIISFPGCFFMVYGVFTYRPDHLAYIYLLFLIILHSAEIKYSLLDFHQCACGCLSVDTCLFLNVKEGLKEGWGKMVG